MRRSTSLSVLTLALASLAFVACGDDADPAPAGGGNTAGTGGSAAGTGGSSAGTGGSAAGTGGSAAGTGGSAAGTGGSTAGTGGSTAGTGGTDAGGSAGTAAGGSAGSAAGGAAGATAADPQGDLAGCTFAGATDATAAATATIEVAKGGGFDYTPKCLKVKKGTVVTFQGNSGSHPLRPFTAKGTLPNPIPSTSDADAKATFAAVGAYGYFCQFHGNDGSTAGMVGAVYVVELDKTVVHAWRPPTRAPRMSLRCLSGTSVEGF